MSLSECGGVCSRVRTSDDCQSVSAAAVLYADMRGELGGDKGMMKFPSTIGTLGPDTLGIDAVMVVLEDSQQRSCED
jgi:hypothetical protein